MFMIKSYSTRNLYLTKWEIQTTATFLAAMSSSSSDHVTPSVCPFVRLKCFFDFAFTRLLGQALWHLWSLKWPRTTLKVSHALPKQMCWSLKVKYEIWIRPLQLKYEIECFAFDFRRIKLAFKSESYRIQIACYVLCVACWSLKQFRVCGFYAIISSRSDNAI